MLKSLKRSERISLKTYLKNEKFYNLYYNILILCVCVCVWPAIDSAPGHHTDTRPVSLEPVGLESVQREKFLPSKWPLAKLSNENVLPLMLLNGKFFYIYFCRSFWVGPLLVNNMILIFDWSHFRNYLSKIAYHSVIPFTNR